MTGMSRTGATTHGLFGRVARRTSRHDLVLVVIPAAFVAALMAGMASPVSLHGAVAAASVVGGIALVDALFLNPPTGPPAPPAA
ncbi:MAG: hypothetical protein ABEJ92_06560 [Halobacteriales archaeon]